MLVKIAHSTAIHILILYQQYKKHGSPSQYLVNIRRASLRRSLTFLHLQIIPSKLPKGVFINSLLNNVSLPCSVDQIEVIIHYVFHYHIYNEFQDKLLMVDELKSFDLKKLNYLVFPIVSNQLLLLLCYLNFKEMFLSCSFDFILL